MLFHSVTCYTNSRVSRIYVNTTKLRNITCSLVATGVILRSLECIVYLICYCLQIQQKLNHFDTRVLETTQGVQWNGGGWDLDVHLQFPNDEHNLRNTLAICKEHFGRNSALDRACLLVCVRVVFARLLVITVFVNCCKSDRRQIAPSPRHPSEAIHGS